MVASGSRMTETVHVVPVAREIDRATLPFLPTDSRPALLHAHRILLVRAEGDASRRVAEKIERALRKAALVEHHVIEERTRAPETDFEQILGRIATLCLRELGKGHQVHVNLSSGTKLFALAAGLAGMAHIRPGRGSLYYVRPSGYQVSEAEFELHGVSKGLLDVEEVQLLPLMLPTPLQRRLLCFLKTRPQAIAEYRDLVEFLSAIAGSGYESPATKAARRVRTWNNAVTTRMVRSLLQPLMQEGLVELRDLGRQRAARLTRRGGMYAALVGLEPARLRDPL
jgi:hypothetical protein